MHRFIYLIFAVSSVYCAVPGRNIEMAEPDGMDYSSYFTRSIENSLERLTSLRDVMAAHNIDAYVIPTADAHISQYLAPADARRTWISGLEGSSGTAVVTADRALIWTDARYVTQFYMQVDTNYWSLMQQGVNGSINNWLLQNLDENSKVGVDPTTYTRGEWTSLETTLAGGSISLEATPENLVDIARRAIADDPPPRPNNDLIILPITFSGRSSGNKVDQLLQLTRNRGSTVLVLTALDDIAYTLNLRGSDIPYNPVFFSYLIIRTDLQAPNNVVLFWGNGTLAPEVTSHLSSEQLQVQIRPYDEIFDHLTNIAANLPVGSVIWLPNIVSHAIYLAAEAGNADITSSLSPVATIKIYKNEVELAGFRNAHIKDGIAVVRALRWVEESVAAGEVVTEMDVSDKFDEFRNLEKDSFGPSFPTIAGAGENGAIIHYRPPNVGSRVVGKDDMLLVDSGGQYMDGTTDITRTRHMSASPTEAQKRASTRVMKGHISLATVIFPRGVLGHRLETLARKSLWDIGLDYGHGTGHGVGHFLNVHEGPAWILANSGADDPGIIENMIFSNEPGYYEVGQYGIRHEDLVEVIPVTRNSDHMQAEGIVGDFGGGGALGFRTISLAPHQTACFDVDLFTDFEIEYINEYHERVLATLGPILQEKDLTDDYEWLKRECAPIARSAAILLQSTPLLILFTLWLRA